MATGVPGAGREVEGERGVNEQAVSPAVEAARARFAKALTAAGELIISQLDNGSTPESLAATDEALDRAKFESIALHELLLEEGGTTP